MAASLAAVVGLIAALGCCLPLAPLLAAAGLAGASAVLAPLRPWLVGGSVLMLAVGFYQMYGRRSCRAGRSRLGVVVLWTAAAVTFVLLAFPQVVAGWMADWK